MRIVKTTLLMAMLAAIGVNSSSTTGPDYVAQFELFKKAHKREYPSASEEAKRLGLFVRNMQRAAALQNANPLARFGANEFADLSEEEFKVLHNAEGHFRSAVHARRGRPASNFKATGSFAQTQDWRQQGAVTPVKNQGLKCGSCWSFSTTGNIEGQWVLAGNDLVSLSEQELVSCDTTCGGCHGGLMDLAFEWLVETQGGAITTEAQYPYVSGDGVVPACDMSGKTAGAYISGNQDIAHDENTMAEWLSTNGPISIGVDAHSWQTYMGGVLTDCISTQVDHGVLAVGFDLTASPPYWIIKNSWGPTWGEDGYIRVEFGSNQCLLTTAPSSSIVSGSNPPTPPNPPTSPPNPPSPSTGTFIQAVCPNAFCLSGCQKNTFPTGVCLQLNGGGSAIASCGSELTLQSYTSSDCSGSYTTSEQAVDQCLQDTSGSYIYNACGSSSSTFTASTANLTLVKRN